MSSDGIELLRRAWAAYDRGDIEGFAACVTEDWLEYDGAGEMGTLDDERRTMAAHRLAFPDKHTEIHRIIADGDLVACHCTTTATHTGRYLDLEPTGKKVALYEMMFNRVVDGRLAETWAVTEGAGFYEQLTGRRAPERLEKHGLNFGQPFDRYLAHRGRDRVHGGRGERLRRSPDDRIG